MVGRGRWHGQGNKQREFVNCFRLRVRNSGGAIHRGLGEAMLKALRSLGYVDHDRGSGRGGERGGRELLAVKHPSEEPPPTAATAPRLF